MSGYTVMSNDPTLSEAVFQVTHLSRKLPELLRDGRLRELELLLGVIHDASGKGVYRCTALSFANSELPKAYT
jgi:hypothetical protein